MAAQSSELPNVRVGVGVFVLSASSSDPKNPTFLLGTRINSHGHGSLALPGGHLDFGESPEDCAAREVLEETGLILRKESVRFLTATNDHMPLDEKHYVTLFMVARREVEEQEARVVEVEKCEGWEWRSWDELRGWIADVERDVGEKKVFLPLVNLVRQRPGVVPRLV